MIMRRSNDERSIIRANMTFTSFINLSVRFNSNAIIDVIPAVNIRAFPARCTPRREEGIVNDDDRSPIGRHKHADKNIRSSSTFSAV